MSFPTVSRKYVHEYIDLLQSGATHEEAIQQVAIWNEVDVSKVLA